MLRLWLFCIFKVCAKLKRLVRKNPLRLIYETVRQHKMKNILLILIILILAAKSNAQDCGYVEYYPLYELAKKNYAQKNYKEAEINIKLAFEKVDFPLGKGLHLALQVAKKQNDSEWAEQISIQLAKGGVPLKYFRHLKNYEWYEKFKTDFKKYSNHYNENFKPELREKLISLIKKDKKFNSRYHDWRTRKVELTLDELIEGASQIVTDFKELTNYYGFPNEKLTGYNYVQRTDRIDYFHTDALMIHIYQRGVIIFRDKMREIVCDGGLHPNYEETLKKIRGFGNSTGVEQEMKVRYEKYRRTE